MRPRYSFSSRRTRRIENIRKQRKKYPNIAESILENSDIILEILDARFIEDTRNLEFEEKINKKNKKIIFVINKADLIKTNKTKNFNDITPKVFVSCKNRTGIKELRGLIKKTSKKIKRRDEEKISVGIIGYPNTGKSSLINLLIGKSSAGVGSDAGFTKSLQKIKLDKDINLIDSPGVIPKAEYSSIDQEKISKHVKVGGRSFSQVKEPEMVINKIQHLLK